MLNVNTKIIRNVIKQLSPFLRDVIILIEQIANDDEIKNKIIERYPRFTQLMKIAEYELPTILKPNIDIHQQIWPNSQYISIVSSVKTLIAWSLEQECEGKESLISVAQKAMEEIAANRINTINRN